MDSCEVNNLVNNVKNFGLEINHELKQVYFGERKIVLTAKEYDILKLLSQNPDTIFTREELLEKIWGYDYYGDSRAVDIQIRRLRKKLEKDPGNPKHILTKWGEGYFYKDNR